MILLPAGAPAPACSGVPRRLRAGVAPLLLSALLSGSCQPAPPEDAQTEGEPAPEVGPPFSLTLDEAGFSTPESILHDSVADVYLVSNIQGDPAGRDGNGFISRVSPDGEVSDLKWIDGTLPGVTLHAPKGMAILADTLFVTDIDCIRRFHRTTGEPLQDLCLEDAFFLNDLAASPRGDLYFTDSGSSEGPGAVYLLRSTADVPQRVTLAEGTVLEGETLGGPNGVAADRRGLYVATFGSGELFRVTPEGERLQLLSPSGMALDGLVSLEERGFLLSSWGDSAVYWIQADGTVSPLVEGVEAPADIGFDAKRNRVLVPLFHGNALRFREVR